MAYVIFDKDKPANTYGCEGKIAIDDAALEKVSPSDTRFAEIVCTITEEQYNGLRLGSLKVKHDGSGNAILEDNSFVSKDPVPPYSESRAKSNLDMYTAEIRKSVKGKVDEDDWLSYADSVDAIDLSSNTSEVTSEIIENAGITFRNSGLQLPLKKA